MAKHGEPPVVLFSEEVLKINRRGEAVPRVMLVASNAVYLLDADTHRVRRKLPLRSLSALRMSELSDNFLAIINPAEYDCLVVCARKTEAVVTICEAHRAAVTALGIMGGEGAGAGALAAAGGSAGEGSGGGGGALMRSMSDENRDAELPVELSLRFSYKAGANVMKQVVFTRLNGERPSFIQCHAHHAHSKNSPPSGKTCHNSFHNS